MRWVLFLLLSFPAFADTETVVDQAHKEALLGLLNEEVSGSENNLDLDMKLREQIFNALRRKLPNCLPEAEPFRAAIPEDLRHPLCVELIKAAVEVGVTYAQMQNFVQSFTTTEQVEEEWRQQQEELEKRRQQRQEVLLERAEQLRQEAATMTEQLEERRQQRQEALEKRRQQQQRQEALEKRIKELEEEVDRNAIRSFDRYHFHGDGSRRH